MWLVWTVKVLTNEFISVLIFIITFRCGPRMRGGRRGGGRGGGREGEGERGRERGGGGVGEREGAEEQVAVALLILHETNHVK